MSSISTDDLMLYLYNEATPEMMAIIAQALENDPSLKEKLETLSAAKKRLDAFKLLSPSDESIDKILHYSSKGK